MINTKLHNALIEKDIEQKALASDINTMLLKRELLKERLKNYSLIVLFLAFVVMLCMILYYFFPYKNEMKAFINHDEPKEFTIDNKPFPKPKEERNKDKSKVTPKEQEKKMVPKNGVDYVKQDNYVYKRIWEDGILVKETKLASTIKESRKIEKIPQLADEIKEK